VAGPAPGYGRRRANENESTYIPIGAKHRLENPGKRPVAIGAKTILCASKTITDGGEVFVSSVLILSVISIY
jgi:Mannose-6-phosphate isomerase